MSFALIGALATGLQYLVLIILVRVGGVDPVLASALGYIFSGILSYRLNYSFTFRSSKSHREAFVKFGMVSLSGLLINTGIMSFGVNLLEVNYLLVQLFSTGAVLFWNFLMNMVWSFR